MVDVGGVGTRINWLDLAIQMIYGERKFQFQLQEAASLKVKIKEAEVFLLKESTESDKGETGKNEEGCLWSDLT